MPRKKGRSRHKRRMRAENMAKELRDSGSENPDDPPLNISSKNEHDRRNQFKVDRGEGHATQRVLDWISEVRKHETPSYYRRKATRRLSDIEKLMEERNLPYYPDSLEKQHLNERTIQQIKNGDHELIRETKAWAKSAKIRKADLRHGAKQLLRGMVDFSDEDLELSSGEERRVDRKLREFRKLPTDQRFQRLQIIDGLYS